MSNNLPSKENILYTKLSAAKPTETFVVVDVSQNCAARNRLTELGFTKHATVKVLRIAPLGDPMEVEIRGYRLCLRRETARDITVKPSPLSKGK